jgi:excisionase family DNA binding protein
MEVTMNQTNRLLLRPAEAAELLGVGRSKLYALLAARELPSVRVGH